MTDGLMGGVRAPRAVPAVLGGLIACAVMAGAPARAQETADALLPVWRAAQADCAAGSPSVAATRAACARRDHFANRLTRAGMCYGRTGEPPAVFDWHVCGPDSTRLPGR